MACRCNYRLLTSNDPSTIPFLRATCAAIAASRCRALVRGVRSSSCPNRQHFTSLAFPTSPSYQEISRVLPGPYWRSSAVLSGATVPHPDPVPHPQKCPDLDDSLISISDSSFVVGLYEQTPFSVIVARSCDSVSFSTVVRSRSNEASNEIATSEGFGVA